MINTLLAIVALPFLYLLYEYISELNFRRLQHKHKCSPPKYISSFPFGIRATMRMYANYKRNNLHPFSQGEFEKNNRRTARLQIVSRTVVTTIDPQNIKAMLTRIDDFDLGERYPAFLPLLGDGIFTLSGKGWHHSRALLKPQFNRDQITRLHSLEQACQDLIQCIKEESTASSDGLVDVQELFFKLTLDTATEFLFGESTDSLSGGKRLTPERSQAANKFQESFNLGQEYLLRRTFAQRWYWLIGGSEFKKVSNYCKQFVDYYVDRALEQARDEKTQSTDDDGKFVFLKELTKETTDPVIMRDQALNILLAGRDTTAGTLSFAIALLVRHKDIWRKLRNSVLTDFGTGTDEISFETLKRSEYLKAVINEVLRLYPIVPINFRQTTRDTTFPTGGGVNEDQPIFLPKGTMIHYHTYSMHRYKGYWGEDANEFRPERWAELKGSQTTWKYIPFNGGPRICLGQQFALTEIGYTLVRLCQAFEDVSTTTEQAASPIEQLSTLTSAVAGGVNVHFTPAVYEK